jgi:hypothetical protein
MCEINSSFGPMTIRTPTYPGGSLFKMGTLDQMGDPGNCSAWRQGNKFRMMSLKPE